MKARFCAVHVLILCICIGQICSHRLEEVVEVGASKQFVDDYTTIAQKFERGDIYKAFYDDGALFDVLGNWIPKDNVTKIDVNRMKEFHSTDKHFKHYEGVHIAEMMEGLKEFQSFLSKELRPEQYNGILDLMYIIYNPKATSDQIESALNYFYGIDTEATKTSYIDSHNFTEITAADCPTWNQKYSEEVDKLKSMIDMKPKVIQDFNEIKEKFPCEEFDLTKFITRLKKVDSTGKQLKITACRVQIEYGSKYYYWLGANVDGKTYTESDLRRDVEAQIKKLESLLFAKLPSETIRGIINFRKVTIPGTPTDEIEKALEYLYDEVPEDSCISGVAST